ncbi:DMT family transporter [Planktothrix sp. FACHB-1365]|uniref:DMT family transporter n=1 Tax=Planktothrix sp. FACHB-1365 TaxID=2692855 RepID=UPI0016845EE4|nr:DMT family transporter [Planktothrix sp. FACHB-1365]MBD2483010.1 EamA family transporter [Planktothrix sp. FACHB-1365]
MGTQDNQPPPLGSGETRPADEILNSVMQELEAFHRQMKEQMSQDIQRLQADKDRLIEDIDSLQTEYRRLQSQQFQTLSDRIPPNPAWLKQLTQIVARNVEQALIARINQIKAASDPPLLSTDPSGLVPLSDLGDENFNNRQLEAVLETSLNHTFQALQQELSHYQSDLSRRLNNMQTLEQQAEALLETIVARLEQQAETSTLRGESSRRELSSGRPEALPPGKTTLTKPPETAPSGAKPSSPVQLGLFLALLSAVSLSLFNVCLKIILKGPQPREILGLFSLEGIISPGIGNSLLILLLRMIVVMGLMPIVATFLYPPVWQDLRRFLQSGDRRLMLTVIGSGFFLFLSQVAIYVAIGEIPTGIAITIFFIYPIVTVIASWGLFGDRPTLIRVIAMITILAGGILCLPARNPNIAMGNVQVGVIAAICAGIAFAGYVLLTQVAAGKLHPIPFSLVNFAAIFVFSAVSLMVLPDNLGISIEPGVWNGLIIGGVVLGVLTLSSYLLNNFAIRSAGASLASIIGTTGPALTALFAFWIIGESIKQQQIYGMALVILGVGAMSVERMIGAKRN